MQSDTAPTFTLSSFRSVVHASILACGLALLPQAGGALLVYEGFDYTTGTNIAGQSGGEGVWGEAWRSTDGGIPTAQSPGLDYESLPVVGNRAELTSNGSNSIFRGFTENTVIGGAEGEIWVSFIGRVDASTGVGYIGFYRGGDTSGFRSFLLGSFSGSNHFWGALADSPSGGKVEATEVGGQTQVFLVARFDYTTSGQLDAIDLWLDPVLGSASALGSPLASIGSADLGTKDYSFDRIRLFGTQNSGTQLDEFRVGTTFESVAIPEPAAIAVIFGCGALLFCLYRRRRPASA